MEYIYKITDGSTTQIALILTIILFVLVIVIGWLVNAIESVFMSVVTRIAGTKVSYIAINYLTFPGTIIHELSHAIFCAITGAKVTEIRFFDKPSSGRLGHVSFIPRGKMVAKALQYSLSSCAPVIVGMAIIPFLYNGITRYSLPLVMKVLLIYLMISVVCHMSMSKEDIKNYIKGSFILVPITWVICFAILTYMHL